MITNFSLYKITALLFSSVLFSFGVAAHSVVEIVKKNKPSIVGVGLYDAMSAHSHQLRGSGFVFGNGTLIATNYHVVSEPLDPHVVQYHIVFSGTGRQPAIHKAEVIATDAEHDLAILKIQTALKPLKLAGDELLSDGQEILLTGFPIGSVLGLYPATHKGIVAAITPDVIPSANANQLSINMLNRLDKPYMIYQLDITAYPGNSGSPVYRADTGEVVAILNKIFIKETKEAVLAKPSGISYAIPVAYLTALLKTNNI